MKKRWYEKLSNVVSTKLTAQEYTLCQKIAREHYYNRYIKAPTNSELIRFVLNEIFEKYRSRIVAKNPGNKQKTQKARQGRAAKKRSVYDLIDWAKVSSLLAQKQRCFRHSMTSIWTSLTQCAGMISVSTTRSVPVARSTNPIEAIWTRRDSSSEVSRLSIFS